MSHVTVLLSSYNGEKYIARQIDSVLAQKKVTVSLLIRDDGSSDNTLAILEEYKKKDSRVDYYQGVNFGPGKSFFDLLKSSGESDYYAFCDQDDIWDEDKLWHAVQRLKKYRKNIPCLYHSNLRVVNEELDFVRLAHKKPFKSCSKYAAFTQNIMTGCTAVFNQQAKALITAHIPEADILHDGWIYLSCSIFGQVVYDFSPHISYRQHGENVVGMHRPTVSSYLYRCRRLLDAKKHPRYDRALLFLKEYHTLLNHEDKAKIREILDYRKSFLHRMRLLFDLDIREQTRKGDLRYRFLILLGRI